MNDIINTHHIAFIAACFSLPSALVAVDPPFPILLVGRPWLYGMIAEGQAGAEQVLQHTIADLDTTMALSGLRTVADIQGKGEDVVVRIDV